MTIHTTHNSQTRVAESGKFKKTADPDRSHLYRPGAIFGSGWLFAASHVASIAGPAGIASWVIGGFAVLLLGIVYCELGAALPRAGGIIRYPVFSHGELMGYLLGFITLIAFSSLISIEIVAARQSCRRLVSGADPAGLQFADAAGVGGAVPAALFLLCA